MRDYTEYLMKIQEELKKAIETKEEWEEQLSCSENQLRIIDDKLGELKVSDEYLDGRKEELEGEIERFESYVEESRDRVSELEESLNLKYEY